MVSEVFAAVIVLLSSKNREIVKSTLGFAKLAIVISTHDEFDTMIDSVCQALLNLHENCRVAYRAKVRAIFERMSRKFG